MTSLRVSGVVLPEQEHRDLWVSGGLITAEPSGPVEATARGWIVPGLVDAHCHIGLDSGGAVGPQTQLEQILCDRDAGTLLIRDCGSAADTRWIQERDDLPRLIRAGRHLARTQRYIRNYAHEIEPSELPQHMAEQARAGDGWVKLVGDWIERDAGDLRSSFPPEAVAAGIAAAQREGARVTAHVFGEDALPALIEAGIDCIEHGTGLSLDLIDRMAAAGTALVPTVQQLNNFPSFAAAGEAKFPAYAAHMLKLYESRRDVIGAAYEAGVPIYAGTDAGGVLGHGQLAEEVLELLTYGLTPFDALGAASWRARAWLGLNGSLAPGTPADFVVYPRNPLEDLTVLREPALIVLRGNVVG